MPVSFTVASHKARPVFDMNPTGLTTRQLLAGTWSPQYKNAGLIRGSSFSGLWMPVSPTAAPEGPAMISELRSAPISGLGANERSQGKTKFRRLIGLFTRTKTVKKTLDVEPSGIPSPSADKNYILPALAFEPAAEVAEEKKPAGTDIFVKDVRPSPNGFADTIIAAYSQHHDLILRPDDVWMAILTQFNFYINANAELLRANFVTHVGKIQLRIEADIFEDMDFGGLAREMVDLIHKSVVDPTLRAWVLPDFSTTTMNDTTVSSILMMATLKSYFEYTYDPITCGIPRVTLEGEKHDWENILQRLEKLKEYGLETIAWYHLLVPVISRFVSAFDDPDGKSNVEFWQKVVNVDVGCNPPSDSTYSGWITAFCVFDDKGKWLGPRLRSDIESAISPDSLTAGGFWAVYGDRSPPEFRFASGDGLVLDGTHFHKIHGELPPSYAEVDVMLYTERGEDQECSMTAGAIGMQACSGKGTGQKDTVRPVIGWWLFNKK